MYLHLFDMLLTNSFGPFSLDDKFGGYFRWPRSGWCNSWPPSFWRADWKSTSGLPCRASFRRWIFFNTRASLACSVSCIISVVGSDGALRWFFWWIFSSRVLASVRPAGLRRCLLHLYGTAPSGTKRGRFWGRNGNRRMRLDSRPNWWFRSMDDRGRNFLEAHDQWFSALAILAADCRVLHNSVHCDFLRHVLCDQLL